MKEILLIRHAKSSWTDHSMDDFDRPLNARGKADAPMMANFIADQEQTCDLIVSSPANRAFSTAVEFGKAFNLSHLLITNDTIYEASISTLLHLINHFPSEANKVLIVGHNPGLSMLVEYLCDEILHMPTCAVVKLKFEVDDWQAVFASTGEKLYFDFPKAH